MIRYTATAPSKTAGGQTYASSLARWLAQQKASQEQFSAAQQPLQESVQMFQPGGGYGAGQKAMLEDQAKQVQAQALASQVASGMSSGSLATSTGLRVKSDLSKNLLGVEDTRTQFLNQALQALSGLRGTQAQTTATTVDPNYNAYMAYLNNLMQVQSQEAQNVQQINKDLLLNKQQPTYSQQSIAKWGQAKPKSETKTVTQW